MRLTPRGWDAVRVAGAAIAEAEQRWTAHVGERNMRIVRRTLQALPPLLDPDGS